MIKISMTWIGRDQADIGKGNDYAMIKTSMTWICRDRANIGKTNDHKKSLKMPKG
jgi:hypothetical protein